MKHMYRKRIPCFLILFAVIFSVLMFTSCQPKEQDLQSMSYEFTLTDQDVDEAFEIAKELEGYIDSGRNFKIISAVEELQEKLDYLDHQYIVGEIKYYSDLEDDEAYDMYVSAEEAYMAVREERLRVLKKLYESDLRAKDKVFADWTEEQIKTLEVSNEEVAALEMEQNDLVREYLALEDPESEAWSDALEEIYFDYVKSGQQLAAIYGYENYYEYAASEIYMRQYSKEQREAFRKSVKEYILPLDLEVDALYREKRDQLTEAQQEQLSSLRKDSYLQSEEYLDGYIDSYPEEMKTVMNYLFDRDALACSDSENAYTIAYSSYSGHCDQPYIFMGGEYQDLLTLVHELGHYVSFYHFSDAELPYDTCEVQSQGNEWLMMYYLDGKIDPEVYEALLLWRLRYGLDTIIQSTLMDEYEETVYCMDQIASPDEFRTIFEEVASDYPGIEDIDSLDYWYISAQYITIESPVYYLSYATSELAAMTFYTIAEEDGYAAAQDIYMDICLETPADLAFLDTLTDVGLPNPFEAETVMAIKEIFETMFAEESVMPAA